MELKEKFLSLSLILSLILHLRIPLALVLMKNNMYITCFCEVRDLHYWKSNTLRHDLDYLKVRCFSKPGA